MGRGRGRGSGQRVTSLAGPSRSDSRPGDAAQQAQALKAQAQHLMDQLNAINQKISEIESANSNPSAPAEEPDTASNAERSFRK
jgi:CHASE3 domain sensor protein